MIVDLHAHYAMHLLSEEERAGDALKELLEGRLRLVDRLRGLLIGLANSLANFRTPVSGPSVTIEHMRHGHVGAILAPLIVPLDEIDLSKSYGAPPSPVYFDHLVEQLDRVERDIEGNFSSDAAIAKNPTELDAVLAAGKIALVHCVEGGFHLGGSPRAIDQNVSELARRGVVYVTLAHLFWRQIATNAPALPFIPDAFYKTAFQQPPIGLSDLGKAAVQAMMREHVLIDITHMSPRAIADTFELLEEQDPTGQTPVIASHMACRFGKAEYNLPDETLKFVARRGGVLGVIFCDHWACDGLLRHRTRWFAESFDVICKQIDRIRVVTGSSDHAAIGSDLDGYIKPALRDLEDMSAMARLADALTRRYGEAEMRRITSENALRVLRSYWGRV